MTRNSNVTFKENFHNIMREDIFHLPKLRSEKDYYSDVKCLFEGYQNKVRLILDEDEATEIPDICTGILDSINAYNDGLPHRSYIHFKKCMDILNKGRNRLVLFQKSNLISRYSGNQNDPLHLYRVRAIEENRTYQRTEIFHTPYHLREKVATCRYSISGFPSLYMGTALALCVEESIQKSDRLFIGSKFQMNRSTRDNGNINIQVMDLSIKPQDFLKVPGVDGNVFYSQQDGDDLAHRYLYWYPLIAACSFIRKSKNDPCSPEYIIPQLLMQWVREQYVKSSHHEELVGIRYFSCASRKAAELGFNYVFPVSGKSEESLGNHYCSVLANAFELTKPIIIGKDNLDFWQSNMDHSEFNRVNE